MMSTIKHTIKNIVGSLALLLFCIVVFAGGVYIYHTPHEFVFRYLEAQKSPLIEHWYTDLVVPTITTSFSSAMYYVWFRMAKHSGLFDRLSCAKNAAAEEEQGGIDAPAWETDSFAPAWISDNTHVLISGIWFLAEVIIQWHYSGNWRESYQQMRRAGSIESVVRTVVYSCVHVVDTACVFVNGTERMTERATKTITSLMTETIGQTVPTCTMPSCAQLCGYAAALATPALEL